jgi:hypothetical protein
LHRLLSFPHHEPLPFPAVSSLGWKGASTCRATGDLSTDAFIGWAHWIRPLPARDNLLSGWTLALGDLQHQDDAKDTSY